MIVEGSNSPSLHSQCTVLYRTAWVTCYRSIRILSRTDTPFILLVLGMIGNILCLMRAQLLFNSLFNAPTFSCLLIKFTSHLNWLQQLSLVIPRNRLERWKPETLPRLHSLQSVVLSQERPTVAFSSDVEVSVFCSRCYVKHSNHHSCKV